MWGQWVGLVTHLGSWGDAGGSRSPLLGQPRALLGLAFPCHRTSPAAAAPSPSRQRLLRCRCPPALPWRGADFTGDPTGASFPFSPLSPHPTRATRGLGRCAKPPFSLSIPSPFPPNFPGASPGGEGRGWDGRGGSAGSRRCWRGGSMPRLRGRPGSSSSSPGGVRESASGCVCVCGVCVCACAPGPPPPPCLPLAARQPGPGAGGGGGAPRAPGGSERPRGGGRRCPMPAGQP